MKNEQLQKKASAVKGHLLFKAIVGSDRRSKQKSEFFGCVGSSVGRAIPSQGIGREFETRPTLKILVLILLSFVRGRKEVSHARRKHKSCIASRTRSAAGHYSSTAQKALTALETRLGGEKAVVCKYSR